MIKKFVKKILFHSKLFQYIRYKNILNIKESDKIIYFNSNKTKQIIKMIDSININIKPNKRFQHWIDENIKLINKNCLIGNIPPHYGKIIDYSLNDLILHSNKEQQKLLQSISKYIDKIILVLEQYNDDIYIKNTIKCFKNIKDTKANNLEEALQRILFWSSLFWQSGHKLVGLGRLDVLLNKFENDYSNEQTILILKDFLSELHNYYEFKSSVLLGDIGQIIIIGGLNEDGSYFCNKLTYAFIEAVKECQYSDPKLLLRVSENAPKDLIRYSLECISTGVGSPLLSNDNIVIPRLIEFGYDAKDAFNYVTSACWEPVSYGNSLEQNNLININFSKVISVLLKDKKINNITCFDDFLNLYKNKLEKQIIDCLQTINRIKWENDPLFTMFTENCSSLNIDISNGGAKYNDYGILSVGMSNAVNSLLNIKKHVFENGNTSLKEINKIISENRSFDELNIDLSDDYYGHDDNTTIQLTNDILIFTSNILKNYKNPLGGKVKFGLSSPGYISEGEQTDITFDNRKSGMPLGVHISANDSVAYSELVSFASQLKYTGEGSNGNVIDYFVSPDFIQNNLEKFTNFIVLSIKKGFFQMQMNVVNSETLIKAKLNPELFPNLIVRVWGFSAYFKDLPEDYQDVLINRARLAEGRI